MPLKNHEKDCKVKCEICHSNGKCSAHHTLIHMQTYTPYRTMRTSAPYQNGNNTTRAPYQNSFNTTRTPYQSGNNNDNRNNNNNNNNNYSNSHNNARAPERSEIKQVSTAALSGGISMTKHLPAIAVTPSGQRLKVRVFVDEGSDKTFATEMVQKRGNFRSNGVETLSIAAFGDARGSKPANFKNVEIPLETKDGSTVHIDATLWQGELGKRQRAVPFDPKEKWSHLQDIQFEDSYPREEVPVDILVGVDQAYKILRQEYRQGKRDSDPVAQNTRLGWVLFGPLEWESLKCSVNFASVNKISTASQESEELFKSFWEVENDAIVMKNPEMTKEDQDLVDEFEKTIEFDQKKETYTVTIPYTEKINELETNRGIAFQAYHAQEKRIDKNPEMRKNINQVFKGLEENNMIEKVPKEELEKHPSHYLIWHAVNRPDHPTTPIRVVHNASKKGRNGISLNDCQKSGPNFLPLIPGLIISWRRYQIAIVADISKMFLRLGIPIEQSDFHRFLYRCDTTQLIEVWRMLVVMFGEKSSPFLANAAVKHHANREDIKEKYPRAVKVVQDGELYMDDTTTGAETDKEAFKLYEELMKFFDSMGMKLHKFNSNSVHFLEAIDQEKRSSEKEVDLVLGIRFDTQKDELSVNVKQSSDKTKPITKRVILSKIASFFDPLGINSPLIVMGKIILQKCWIEQVEWDEPVSAELQKQFELYERASAHTLKIRRPYTLKKWSGTQKQLHCFCDASEEAYASCIYLQVDDELALVISKARVKPLKEISLPRLELLGALITTRLCDMVKKHLKEPEIKVNYWTDSTIVINWLHSEPYKMKTFVRNRVVEIQKASSPLQWRWVPGEDNPADMPSRGIWPLSQEQEDLYLKGPKWVPDQEQWPDQPQVLPSKDELKKDVPVPNETANLLSITVEIERMSTLKKLLNVQAYVFRFTTKAGEKAWRSKSPTAEERRRALKFLMKEHQGKFFKEEIRCLENRRQLGKKSAIASLCPYMEEGILRVGGRLHFSNLLPEHKHQVILSPDDHLTQLIIKDHHEKNLHCGASQLLNGLREDYWILKGGLATKKFTRRCFVCQKVNKRHQEQVMAPLPDFRCTESPPFTHTGLDFAGPLFVKENPTRRGDEITTKKVWIVLFTCAATRAVHLETVDSMSADTFLAALHRFTARRGMPTNIYSDNTKQFIRAEKELQQLHQIASSDKVIDETAQHNINWHYNPPLSPHFGGMWERLVKSVKIPLKKVLKTALVTEMELYTLLCQIEQIINSRPLTAIRDDVGIVALTPAMILIGRNYQNYPEAPPPRDNEIIKRWRYRQQIERQFWAAWQKEYLPLLQQRSKWRNERHDLSVDDIVLVTTDQKRQTWPLGRVIETFKGRDGHVRSANVRVGDKTLKRSIQQLVHLEMDFEPSTTQ